MDQRLHEFIDGQLPTAKFCSRQLTDFQVSNVGYEAEQIRVIEGAMDSVGKTKEFAEKLRLTFPYNIKQRCIDGAESVSNYQAYPRIT